MAEKVIFSFRTKTDDDGTKIEINDKESFFIWNDDETDCGCGMVCDQPMDFTVGMHGSPFFVHDAEPRVDETLSWLKSMYEDFYGDPETD